MSSAQKYAVCIVGGVLAVISAPILVVALGFALSSIHFQVSQNLMVLAFPFCCYSDLDASLPLYLVVIFATLLQWPIYGWIIGSGWVHNRLSKYATLLACFHIIAVAIAFWYTSKHPLDLWKGARLG
jgi:hypothetical protein